MALTVGSGTLKGLLNGVGSGGGLNRIGLLTNASGRTHTCFYDPVADKIWYEDDSDTKIAPKLESN